MKTFIYILIDPRDNQVRYVGKTKSINRRYYQHNSEASKIRNHKNNWLLSLKNNNLKPEMVTIDECEDDSWVLLEQWYIELFKSWGYKLTNLTKGGEGAYGYKHTEESKQKMSHGNKGKIISLETREKISKAVKGRKYSDEIKIKASQVAKKRGISPETRDKMVESRKRNGNYGKSEQTKAFISQKMKIIANEREIKNNRPTNKP